ncbi:TraR/DksA family transcriptional regulator [Candidatus Fokinia solitaria]|nr:TraR/DksA C4-type zinc finger protein [Candidatus Fokinia solitaria]
MNTSSMNILHPKNTNGTHKAFELLSEFDVAKDAIDDYIPSPDEEYMSEKHLQFFKSAISNWRGRLLRALENAKEYLAKCAISKSEEMDGAVEEANIHIKVRETERLRKLIERIDSTLRLIEDKKYGFCEETGEPIGIMRLLARPTARKCLMAQEIHENFEKRHNKQIFQEHTFFEQID